ncbi:MAG: T9SS type A sorting domain-containing protein [Candidatus Kapaibacterium sp.]
MLLGRRNNSIVNNCLGCHDGANAFAGIDLSTDDNINSMKELILCTVMHGTDCKPMPDNGLKLSSCEQNFITRWVNQSAVGNIHEGTPLVQSLAIIPSVVNEGAVVRFSVEQRQHLTLSLYNYSGQKLRTLASGDYSAGTNQVSFMAQDLARGVYFVRITSGTSTQSVMFTH